MANFTTKDIVKYRTNWCTEAEQDMRFVVVEVFDHSDDKYINEVRYGIGWIMNEEEQKNHPFGHYEVVSEKMIERA